MTKHLLPHYWKKVALGIFVLAIASWFVNAAYPELINLDPYKFSWILKIIILFSLLLFVSTREKEENLRITKLRLNCLFTAITVGALIPIIEVFMEVLFEGENAEITTGYELMMLVLLVYYLNFYIKKNIKTVSRN